MERNDAVARARVQFEAFATTPALRPPHVARAMTGLASALLEYASVEGPRTTVEVQRLEALLADAEGVSLARLRARQLALLEFALAFADELDNYYELDIALHAAVAEALLRHEVAWLHALRRLELASSTTFDAEAIEATLGEVLTVMALAYDFAARDVAVTARSSSSLQSVLSVLALGGAVVPASRVKDFARCLRIVIRQRLQFSLTDAVFLVRLGVGLSLDDAPLLRRRLLAAQGVEALSNLTEVLLVGYPRVERTLSVDVPRVVGRYDAALEAYMRFRALLQGGLALLGEAMATVFGGAVFSDETRRALRSDASLAALAVPLWSVLVILACVRTSRVLRRMVDATPDERSQFSRLLTFVSGVRGEPPVGKKTLVRRADLADQLFRIARSSSARAPPFVPPY